MVVLAPEQLEQREVLQQAVEEAPCITFGEFRNLAKQRGWIFEWLLEQVKGELDKPTDTLRRIMYGALVDGKHQLLPDVVIPYTCLIELYQRATQPKPALTGEKACACGCGGALRGKQRYASPLCRKRAQRARSCELKAATVA
jgi:hypothetical protein